MSRFRVHAIERASVREEGKAQELSAEFEMRVAEHWSREQASRSVPLEDAPIFNVTHFDSGGIRGHFVPYRRWIAQLREPGLREILRVQPGSVCGVTRVEDATVFGLRGPHTTQDPGCWEPVPAGGIGHEARGTDGGVDAARQLLQELEEELGLASDGIQHVEPFALVVDLETRVHDLVYAVDLALSRADLEARFALRSMREVSELRVVPDANVVDWLAREGDALAPITEVLLSAYASWRQGA